MFKRILVAVDGSTTANRGLKLALSLAKDHGATLHVVHVVDELVIGQGMDGMTFVPANYVDSLMGGLREAGRRILARAEEAARKNGQSVETVLVETMGQGVASAVLTQARRLRAELIVLGTHGRRGLSRLVMGSDAETIVREARVPVLLVRSPATVQTARSAGSPSERRPATRAPRAVGAGAALKRPVRRKRAG